MRKESSFLLLGAIVGALLTALAFIGLTRSEKNGRGAANSSLVLKLAHGLDQSHPVHLGMVRMAERLDELSGGTVELQIFPNGQLGSEAETIEQLQRGAIAMVKTSAASMEGFVPEMAVFGLPYLFRDEGHYWRVLESDLGRELLQAGERVGMRGICYYDSGSRSFYTNRPVRQPEDLRGMKIRVLPSRMAMDMISSLGASPTPVPWGELYTALQQGMVDGAENNPPSILTSRHYEVSKYLSLNEHTRVPDLLIMSRQVWEGLPAEVQRWVQEAADESVEFQRELWTTETEKALEQVEKAGMEVIRPDQAAFAAATEPLRRRFEETPVGQVARRIEEIR